MYLRGVIEKNQGKNEWVYDKKAGPPGVPMIANEVTGDRGKGVKNPWNHKPKR